MRNPYAVIYTEPPMTVCYQNDDTTGIVYYVLTGIGTIHQPITGEESANVTLTLDCDGEIEQLFTRLPPLRTKVDLFTPSGTTLFSGMITMISISDSISLTVEA